MRPGFEISFLRRRVLAREFFVADIYFVAERWFETSEVVSNAFLFTIFETRI